MYVDYNVWGAKGDLEENEYGFLKRSILALAWRF
jgi:hypothetical protein